MSSTIHIQIACQKIFIPNAKQLRRWIFCAIPPDKRQQEIVLRIVDVDESAALNEYYRHKKGATNVLSFPATTGNNHLGDIVICAPLVLAEAKQYRKNKQKHWAHLVIHGTLHLIGYDHIKKSDARVMEGLEIIILRQLGYRVR